MALQQSVAVRNAGLDAKETAIGTSPVLKIRTKAAQARAALAEAITTQTQVAAAPVEFARDVDGKAMGVRKVVN